MELTWTDEHFAEQNPNLLYHYTDGAGLRGMLESGRIWATNVRFLNDTKEGELPFEMGLQELKKAYARAPEQTEEMAKHIQVEEYFGGGLPLYVSSFSSVHDSLSQWRGYGGPTQGYTLAFDRDELAAHAQAIGWSLKECVYNEQELRSYVRMYVQEGLDDVGGYPKNNEEENRVGNRIRRNLGIFAEKYKHEAFKEEHEWRLVGRVPVTPQRDDISFRVAARGLVPYVEVPLPRTQMYSDALRPNEPPETMGLKVAAIGLGPGWTRATEEAVRMLCHQMRVRLDSGIYKSTAPYLPT